LEIALGGPLVATFKNADYTLHEALNLAARLCAPPNAQTRVDVDRFTEFTVTYDSAVQIPTNQMVKTARSLLPLTKTYLDAVRFAVNGRVSGEINRSDIEFIDDWARAPEQRIVALLPRETQSRIIEDAAAIDRLRIEQKIEAVLAEQPELREKAERADQQLRQAIQDAYGELRSALESVRKAAALHEVRTMRGLDNRERELREAIKHTELAEVGLADPIKVWEHILESEGISGELRDSLVKTFPAMFRSDPQKAAKVFEALRGEIESVRFLQRIITTGGDKWRFTSDGISFRDEEFARRVENAQRQFREDAQGTDAALKAWQEAVGP
jgi:hypothetical protein